MPIVTTHLGPTRIDDTPHWHIVGVGGPATFMFYNNVRVSQGSLVSVSAIGLQGAVTLYSVAHRDREKEQLFERVRAQSYAALPTRLRALFVFDDLAIATLAQETWFR